MASVVSIPDKYIEMAIKLTGVYNPKEAILKTIDLAYREIYEKESQFKTANEINCRENKNTKSKSNKKYVNIDELDYFERLKQATKYVNKIIKEDGKISEDKLYKVLARFKVSEEDLLRETGLVMRETGEYYPM